MSAEQLPKIEEEPYNPNLEAQDEELASGGNNRLVYILGAVILALVLTYIALPKGEGEGVASMTPSFLLDDAAVTATTATSADSIAAGLKAAPKAANDAAAEEKSIVKTTTAANVAVPVAAVGTAAAPAAAAPAAPAAPVAPEPVAAAPEPAAPTSVTVSGKIDDENGRPLAGATIMLKGSTKVASTDANGNYSIEVPSGTENTFIYGYGGYEDEVQRSSGGKPLNVTLTPRAKAGKKRR